MRRFLPALCALLLLAGCGMSDRLSASVFGKPEDLPDCPDTGLLEGADTFPVFKEDGRSLNITATLPGVSGGCNFDKPGEADMEIKLTFAAIKNDEAFPHQKVTLPYFIAILSPDERVLQRQSFSTTIDFDNNVSAAASEEHDLVVPVPAKNEAYKYKVVAGFELTPAQLEYNRKGKDAPVAKQESKDAH